MVVFGLELLQVFSCAAYKLLAKYSFVEGYEIRSR
jgi:hypothetical protein